MHGAMFIVIHVNYRVVMVMWTPDDTDAIIQQIYQPKDAPVYPDVFG